MIISQQGVVVVGVGNNPVLWVRDDDSWSKVELDKVMESGSVPDLCAGL